MDALPSGCKSQGWIRSKSKAKNSILISHEWQCSQHLDQPRCINKELDQKLSSCNSNQYPKSDSSNTSRGLGQYTTMLAPFYDFSQKYNVMCHQNIRRKTFNALKKSPVICLFVSLYPPTACKLLIFLLSMQFYLYCSVMQAIVLLRFSQRNRTSIMHIHVYICIICVYRYVCI